MSENTNRLFFHILTVFLIINLLLPGERHYTTLTVTQVVIYGLAGIYVLFLRPHSSKPKLLSLVFVYATALAISQLASLNALGSMQMAVQITSMVVLAWLVAELRPQEEDVRLFAFAVVTAAAVLSIYGIIQLYTFFSHPPDPELVKRMIPVGDRTIDIIYGQKRISSVFGLPTTFSAFLAMAAPLGIALAVYYRRNYPALLGLLVALAVMTLAFVNAKSHGGPVSLLAAGMVTTILLARKRRLHAVFGVLLVILIGVLIIWSVGYTRGHYIWDFGAENNPVRLRGTLWLTGMAMWAHYWLLGTGLGNFYLGFFPFVSAGAPESKFLHNTYLQLPIELGLAGLVLLVCLVGLIISRLIAEARKGSDSRTPLDVGIITAVLTFLFLNGIEIVLYLYSIGLMGAFLTGLWLRNRNAVAGETKASPGLRPGRIIAAGICVVFLVLLGRWFFADYFFMKSNDLIKQETIEQNRDAVQAKDSTVEKDKPADAHSRKLKHWEEIKSLSEYAVAIEEGDFLYHSLLADSYRELWNITGDDKLLDRAEAHYARAVELCPSLPSLRYDYAVVLSLKKKWLAANMQIATASRIYPASARYAKGRQAAEKLLKRLVSKDSKESER